MINDNDKVIEMQCVLKCMYALSLCACTGSDFLENPCEPGRVTFFPVNQANNIDNQYEVLTSAV